MKQKLLLYFSFTRRSRDFGLASAEFLTFSRCLLGLHSLLVRVEHLLQLQKIKDLQQQNIILKQQNEDLVKRIEKI
jgi:hypothetical protein